MNLILLFLQMTIVTITIFCSSVMLIALFSKKDKLFSDPKPLYFPTVSIAVPVYNKENVIGKTLRHLFKLEYPKNPEIIVVNDGSNDNTEKVLKKLRKKYNFKFINKKKNEGKSKAINDALKIARGEIFGFIDADTFIERDSLKNLIGYFNDKGVGAVIPAMKVYKPKNFFEKLQKIEYVLTILARKLLTFLNCLFLTPGCAFFRKNLLRRIGGFDEKNMTEDLEIGLRIRKTGYEIENSLNALVYTIAPKKFKDLTKQRLRWYRGLLHNLKKYKELFFEKSNFGLFLMPFVLVGGTMAILLFFFLLLIVLFDSIYNSWVFLNGFALSSFDISLILPQLKFEPSIFFFLTVLFLLMFAVNIYFSKKVSRESIINDIWSIILFILIYSPLLSVWWLTAVAKEITGAEKKW